MVSKRSSSFRKKARRVLSLIYTPRKLLSSNFFPFAFLILDEPSRIHIQNEKVGGRNQFSISNVFYGSLISKHWFNLKEGSGCYCCWLSLNWNSEMSLFCFFKRCYDVQPMKSYLHFFQQNWFVVHRLGIANDFWTLKPKSTDYFSQAKVRSF